ncbi:MAG: hypothetical protein IT258_09550 [Saprospiraceae bacterium]|nr:hypothetical protein [Saprospiraceae bacterium]
MKKTKKITLSSIREWLTGEDHTPSPIEVADAEDAILAFAQASAVMPPSHLRSKILSRVDEIKAQKDAHQKLELDKLPMLADNANWFDWNELAQGIEPPDDFENIHLHPLESNEKRELFVAWVKEMVEEEVHHDLLESILILDGSCECHINNEKGESRTVRLGQGEFITMQIGETHDIVITSLKPAKAILEWRKVAA